LKKKKIVLLLCAFLIFLDINIISSQTQKTNKKINQDIKITPKEFEYSKPQKAESPSYFILLLKTFLILLVFGVGVYYIFKYISKKQGFLPVSTNIIKLISTVPVGTNRFVQLIEVGTHYYLIGSTESGITLLSEISDNESINMIKIQQNKVKPMQANVTFFQFIKDLIGHIPGKKGEEISKIRFGFLKRQKERLKNMNKNKKL